MSLNKYNAMKYEGLGASETTEALPLQKTGGGLCSVFVTGTFGGTVTLQGSFDGVTWFSMNDNTGSAVAFTAEGYAELSTAVPLIRWSTGAGVSDVDAFISTRS